MGRPRFPNNDPNDPVNVVAGIYDGLADDAPTGDDNVDWHPWQNSDAADTMDPDTDYSEYDDEQE